MTTIAVRAIPARDWEVMSWYQRKTWLARYAKAHRPATVEERFPEPEKCQKADRADRVQDILDLIAENPTEPGHVIAERAGGYRTMKNGKTDTSGMYALLRRYGHHDAVEQMTHNSHESSAAATMTSRKGRYGI